MHLAPLDKLPFGGERNGVWASDAAPMLTLGLIPDLRISRSRFAIALEWIKRESESYTHEQTENMGMGFWGCTKGGLVFLRPLTVPGGLCKSAACTNLLNRLLLLEDRRVISLKPTRR